MPPAPGSRPIAVLLALVKNWVDTSFPTPSPETIEVGPDLVPADRANAIGLNVMWIDLAEVLRNRQEDRMAPFLKEIRLVGQRAGSPPMASLDQRLHELVEAGLDELFLVMTVRWAVGYLIERGFPAEHPRWQELVDTWLQEEGEKAPSFMAGMNRPLPVDRLCSSEYPVLRGGGGMPYKQTATHCIVRRVVLRGLASATRAQCQALRAEAGRVWTTLVSLHVQARAQGRWLDAGELEQATKGG